MTIENRPKQIEYKTVDNRDQHFYGKKTFVDETSVDSIQFNTAPTTLSTAEGLLKWNSTDGTLDLGMSGGDITLQVGQEMFIKVRNVSGLTIPNGTPVYISGRTGNRPNVYLAQSDLDSTSVVVGLTTESITSPSDGFITTMGYVRQIKTNYSGSGAWGTTWAEGDSLYISKTNAGQLTNIEPTAPHHSDCVGSVGIVGSAGVGSILVDIQRHVTMEELADIDGTPLTTTGQIPSWHNDTKVFDFDINMYMQPAHKVGTSVNNTEFESDGTIKFNGAATVFNDLLGDITGVKTLGTGVSINSAESNLAYTAAANTSDYAYFNYQLSHSWKLGSTVYPHIHFEQNQNAIPNWLIQYRWQIQGLAKTTLWTNAKYNTGAFTYTSGTLNQISYDGGIAAPVGAGLSDIIQIRLIRDTNNSSGLFAGVDTYTGVASVTSIDLHYEIDSIGSRTEYQK